MAGNGNSLTTWYGGFVWGTADLRGLTPWRVAAVQALRHFHVMLRDLAEGDLLTRASSLAYTTLLSFVPLLAVSFSLLKGFGVHNQLEPALLQIFAPLGDKGSEITARIIGFVENMEVGVLGAVGVGILLFTVVSVMQKIERAFNQSWRVSAARSFKTRFSDYLSVLLVGPVLTFAALGITGAATNNRVVKYFAGIEPFGAVLEGLSRLVPYLMIIGAFAFMYVFMPNTKVRVGSAVFGALIAGILWQTTGLGVRPVCRRLDAVRRRLLSVCRPDPVRYLDQPCLAHPAHWREHRLLPSASGVSLRARSQALREPARAGSFGAVGDETNRHPPLRWPTSLDA